ncbi:MAG: SURF1 family protein [Mesorhizobium sp.]
MTTTETLPRRGRFPWLLTLLSLASLVVLLGLGTWQVQRLAWKDDLVATINSRLTLPPVPLDEALKAPEGVSGQEYRPVTVEGQFRHEFERHFFATHDGATGYFVYTPLLRDQGDWVFVNRGFVPFEMKDAAKRAEGQVDGHVRVTGLLRTAIAEKPSSLVPDNDLAKNIFYWKDIRDMAASSGLPSDAPVLGLFVDADKTPNPGGWPIGGVTLIELPNNHLQYAVTWYGIAAALVGVYLAMIARWWRGAAKVRT